MSMSESTLPIVNEPRTRKITRHAWRQISAVGLRLAGAYCIFGVLGVLFVLYRTWGPVLRGPGDSGI